MEGYDKLKAYTNVNLAAIFTNEESGWRVMAYVKNVLDKDNITGAFLNSDDTGLTTNVFLTEPRLYGLRVTKEWTGGSLLGSFGQRRDGAYPFTIELGGQVQRHDAPAAVLEPDFVGLFQEELDPLPPQEEDLDWGDGREVKLTWRASDRWSVSAGARFGQTNGASGLSEEAFAVAGYAGLPGNPAGRAVRYNYTLTAVTEREEHTLADFMVGMDVGLGSQGTKARSTLAVGVRYAQFESRTYAEIGGIPDYYIAPQRYFKYPQTHTQYLSTSTAQREFEGTGPIISWDASLALVGGEDTGTARLDWSVTGGVLFGKQESAVEQVGTALYDYVKVGPPSLVFETLTDLPPVSISRSDDVTVPIFGASLGLSYEIDRVKIGAGYRWERYFDVIDGGETERVRYDRTIDGPYFKIAVGFGG